MIREIGGGGTRRPISNGESLLIDAVRCLRPDAIASFVDDYVPLAQSIFFPIPFQIESKSTIQHKYVHKIVESNLDFVYGTIELIVVPAFSGVCLLYAFLFDGFDLQFSLSSDFL